MPMPTRTLLLTSTVVLVALIAGAPFVLNEGFLRLATECLLLLTMAQMWNLLAGYAGLVSLGHQVFIAFGAYALFLTSGWLEVTPIWVLPVAPLVAAAVAAIIAFPLFRLRDAYFSIAMWVFAEIIGAFTMKSQAVGGTSGVPLATSKLIDFDWFEPTMFWLAGGLTLVTIAALYKMMTSSFGLGLMSVRDNDLAAMSVGVDVRHNRFIAFVLSAAGCGLAGALSFMGNLFIAPLAAVVPAYATAPVLYAGSAYGHVAGGTPGSLPKIQRDALVKDGLLVAIKAINDKNKAEIDRLMLSEVTRLFRLYTDASEKLSTYQLKSTADQYEASQAD